MTKDHFKEPLPPGVKNLDNYEIDFPEHNLEDYVCYSPIKIKNLLYRRVDDLTSAEKQFYTKHQESGDNPLINSCDKYKTIHYDEDLYWDDEHDLKGNYSALCEEAYKEIGGTPLEKSK